MRSSVFWYLPDRRWWLRLVTIPLIFVALAGVIWWCIVVAQTWHWPAALTHLGVQVLLVAALWLVTVLPNEILLLMQAWRRQRRRGAAARGRHDALPPADLATDLSIPAVDNLTLPVTWKGIFPKPDFSLAALGWQIVSLVGAIGLFAISGGMLAVTFWFAISGQMAGYAAYLRENGVVITPLQIAIGAALLFPVACAWSWRARQPDRAVPFTLTVTTAGIMWQPEGWRAMSLRWDDMRSLEVALPPHDPALPAPRATVFVLRGRHTNVWWYDVEPGPLRMAMTLIARQSGLPITTLEPSLSTQLPRAWHILSRNNSYQVLAGYLILMAAAIALVPPTPIGWLNTMFGEIILGGAVVQLAAFMGFSAQSTWRYQRIRRHPLHIVLPPPPSDVGATYIITYQALWLGRLLALLASLPLACGFPIYAVWVIQAAAGAGGAVQIIGAVPLLATVPLSALGVFGVIDALVIKSRRYAVEVSPDTMILRYLGRVGKRDATVVGQIALSQAEQLLIRVREGRVLGFRILYAQQRRLIPWPALRGRCVKRGDGGPPITAAELAALVAARSGQTAEIWDQTGEPYENARQALRNAAIITRSFGVTTGEA